MYVCMRVLYVHMDYNACMCIVYVGVCRIGIVRPLNQFLNTEFGQVNVSKKAFHKSHTKVIHLIEKLCQVIDVLTCVCVCVCVIAMCAVCVTSGAYTITCTFPPI